MQSRPDAFGCPAVEQERIGSDQENFKKHEQVEQIAGEDSAADAHHLKLKKRVKTASLPVVAAQGVKKGGRSQNRGDKKHERRQTVNH